MKNGVRRVVDGARDVGQKVEPIILIEIDVASHDLLYGSVGDFGLPVETLVICVRKGEACPQYLEETRPHSASELGVTVGDDLERDPVFRKYFIVELLRYLKCGGVGREREKEHLFG